jgi:hypothetical protein
LQKTKKELWMNEILVSGIKDQVIRGLIPAGVSKVRIIPGEVICKKGQNIESFFKSGFSDWKRMP